MQRLVAVSVFLAVTWLAPGLVAGQETVVTGLVTTRVDGLPLPGTTVTIDSLTLSTVTDASGRYSLTVPASAAGKTVALKVAASGLVAKTQQVKISPGTLIVDFGLALGFQEEVVVGSRAPGTEAEKAVPVDILTQQQIVSTGYTETAQVIEALAPSFNFPRPTITDGTDTVRPATLRGLGPDQVLVLINGKRRHTSALVHLNGSIGRGSTGVDLNAIPVSAIEKIEVLRDGAAAQYGSDAIAGVINIVLKSSVSPLTLTVNGGTTKGSFTGNTCTPNGATCTLGSSIDFSDGGLVDSSGSYGWKMGRGTISLSAEYRHRNRTNRASFDPRDQIKVGDAGNNPVPEPNHRWGDPDTRDFMSLLNLSVPVNKDETSQFYAFGGVSRREANSAGFYRRSLDARNWPQIYPRGFLPEIRPTVVDGSGTLGVRGVASNWFYDVSAQYGHNNFDFTIGSSLNVSLGPTIPPNKTLFDAGSLAFNQFIGNVDLSRGLEVGLAGPLNVAFGFEYRRENYQITAGESASYGDGGIRNQFGGRAAIGAQVFPGFRPGNMVDASRNNVATYVDLEGDLVKRLRVGMAGRYEHYNDFGSKVTGKATVRIEADKKFVIRGAASTGFRAPSLGQSYFSSTATNFLNVAGQGLVPFESLTLPVGSPAARVLGASDLRPEDSVHFSGGFVFSPLDAFSLTADYYHIAINHRIVLSGNFTGPKITALLAPFGANSARFFTNAIDTRTQGVDVTANYRVDLHEAGKLTLSAGYNHTETKIQGAVATPPQLAEFAQVLFDRIERRRIECGQPKDAARLSGDWRKDRWGANVFVNRFGEFCSFTLNPSDDQTFGAKWLTDVEVAFREQHITLAVGAQNIFNVLPDRNITQNSFSGIQTFPSQSPFGMNGRFLYGRITYRF
jgi:iron complex outermembrane receptor protein